MFYVVADECDIYSCFGPTMTLDEAWCKRVYQRYYTSSLTSAMIIVVSYQLWSLTWRGTKVFTSDVSPSLTGAMFIAVSNLL